MTDEFRVHNRLHGHDAAMHSARPDREPDQAAMRKRVSGCDHRQVVGSSRVPGPTGGPNDRKRVDGEGKNEADHL